MTSDDIVENIFYYWIDCVCQFFFTILGVIMNLIIILIISSKKDLHNIFNWMVLTLSCCDTTVLLSMLLLSLSTTPYISFDQTYLIMLLPHFTYPAVHIASTASAVMTVALAHERYLAVQAPIVYSQMLRRASAQRRRLAMHVLPVLLFAILFNLPTFWCVENCCDEACYAASTPNTTTQEDLDSLQSIGLNVSGNDIEPSRKVFDGENALNQFQENLYNPSVIATPNSTTFNVEHYVPNSIQEISKNKVDQTTFNSNWNQTIPSNKDSDDRYVTITSLQSSPSDELNHDTYQFEEIGNTCTKIGFKFTDFRSHPFFIMFYQNLARLVVLGMMPFAMLIFFNCSIYLAIRRRRVRHRHQEENMAIVLMGIVSLFLVCNSFRIFLNFYEAVYEIKSHGSDESGPPIKSLAWYRHAGVISNLFVTLNACCNLIIYCALNNQFRNHFFEVIPFCCRDYCYLVRDRNENIPLQQNANNVETQAILATPNPTHIQVTNTTDLNGTNGIRTMVMDGDGDVSNRNDIMSSTNDVDGKEDHV